VFETKYIKRYISLIIMWVAKMKISSKGTLIGSRAEKYGIDWYGYPVSFVPNGNWITLTIVGRIIGDKTDKKKFINELKKQDRILNIEQNEDFIITVVKDPISMKFMYNEKIIHIEPALISHKGYEIVNIASFERKLLENAFSVLKREHNGELLSIQNRKLSGATIMKVASNLTKKQQDAIDLAIKHGYYNSPRKISVEKLAKIAKLSFSTYQVHLRKAESKLMPQLLE